MFASASFVLVFTIFSFFSHVLRRSTRWIDFSEDYVKKFELGGLNNALRITRSTTRASDDAPHCASILLAVVLVRFYQFRRRFSLPWSGRVTTLRARIPGLPKPVAFPPQVRGVIP